MRLRASAKAEVALAGEPPEGGGKPGAWSRWMITLHGDRLTAVQNGWTVIDGKRIEELPPRGPIVLQGRGGAVRSANLFLLELGDG